MCIVANAKYEPALYRILSTTTYAQCVNLNLGRKNDFINNR